MTADEPRVRVTTNLAFGICLILLGSVLILDRLQLVAASQLLQFWPLGLVLFGIALVIQSFQRVDTTAAPQREGARLGPVIGFVILAAFIFNWLPRGVTVRTEAGERASVVAVMSRHQQVSSAAVFRGGEMTSIVGRAELDLRNTTVAPGEEAAIEIFTVMGGATIHVPEGWHVDVRATPVMGGVRDRRNGARDVAGAPRIVIRGFIMMGSLDIRS
jgi:predicted membrane protein